MKRIIYTCPYVPAEWITAHNFMPVRIMPGRAEKDPFADISAGMCHYMQHFLHDAATMKNTAAVLFSTVCDQMRRAPEYFQTMCAVPVFLINVPATWQSVEPHKLYLSELKRLGRFMQALGNKSPTKNKLIEIMSDFKTRRSSLLSSRSILTPRAFSEAITVFHRSGKLPEEHPDTKLSSISGIPVGLIGGPLIRKDFALFDLIEKAGGYVVLDGTETGERTMPRPFHPQNFRNDPLMELADAYFGSIPDAFRRPNSELYQWLKEMIVKRNIKGLIFIRNIWCDIWHGEVQRMREWLKIPLLDLDLNGTDPMARNSTRITAFLELLK